MPNSHDNIPSILSKHLPVLRVCGEYVTAITAQSTTGGEFKGQVMRRGINLSRMLANE